MKRLIPLFLAACLLLTGCGWMDGYHVSVTPHQQHSGTGETQAVAVANYLQLRTALEDMVGAGIETRVISVADFPQDRLESSLDMTLRHIKTSYPIGAYAVEDISYEIGISGGVSAVAITVTYLHERSEIQKIQRVSDMDQARERISTALTGYEASLVLLVEDYQATDVHQLVDDFAEENPGAVMEIPEVSEQIYPHTGRERVLELKFTYQSSRDSLRSMQEQVQRIFDSAALYVSHDAQDGQKLSQLYSFLMERFDTYQIKTSITPAYSLLSHGVGDSSAFAVVYAEMCDRAGVECLVVVGARNGEPRYWNIVRDGEYYYHVDLLACLEQGGFQKLTDRQMSDYVWDYSAYPECTGAPPAPPAAETTPPSEASTQPPEQETSPPTSAPEN